MRIGVLRNFERGSKRAVTKPRAFGDVNVVSIE